MDFFSIHDANYLIVLLGCTFFPRITMLFIGGPFTLLHWVGWFFVPHITVAILATILYWNTNPELCIISWLMALVGTTGESKSSSTIISR